LRYLLNKHHALNTAITKIVEIIQRDLKIILKDEFHYILPCILPLKPHEIFMKGQR